MVLDSVRGEISVLILSELSTGGRGVVPSRAETVAHEIY